jgi:hypothetical protein
MLTKRRSGVTHRAEPHCAEGREAAGGESRFPQEAAAVEGVGGRSRYRETDHVKAFYRTNGYETLKK